MVLRDLKLLISLSFSNLCVASTCDAVKAFNKVVCQFHIIFVLVTFVDELNTEGFGDKPGLVTTTRALKPLSVQVLRNFLRNLHLILMQWNHKRVTLISNLGQGLLHALRINIFCTNFIVKLLLLLDIAVHLFKLCVKIC